MILLSLSYPTFSFPSPSSKVKSSQVRSLPLLCIPLHYFLVIRPDSTGLFKLIGEAAAAIFRAALDGQTNRETNRAVLRCDLVSSRQHFKSPLSPSDLIGSDSDLI